MSVLGIDYGKKQIGLAISPATTNLAVGYKVIEREKLQYGSFLEAIKEIVDKEQVSSIVIGLPKRMDNTLGISAKEVSGFAEELKQYLNLPVILWDERLTSKQAEVLLRDINLSRKEKRKQINVASAQLILENYLSSKHD
ncbi:MAG: Holliday junction resolvase RuvX [Planctomycetota bacterium]|nr:Holliday junction resolvase RuvX [Planctomycetota bacterium]MDI6786994.1 Holliday junction resolvase RuvX [Planctomycetota bacterium]